MEVELLPVAGAFVLHRVRHSDSRGFFQELFRSSDAALPGTPWQQVSWSHSTAGVLRGIHVSEYTKIVTVTRGAVVDVIVDLRPDSPTYLRWCRTELAASTPAQLVVPPHCGHGFLCLRDADFLYLQGGEFFSKKELTVHYLDPLLDIRWPIERFGGGDKKQSTDKPILSAKDESCVPLRQQRPHLEDKGPAGRVLVVGAAGQVGSALLQILGPRNCIAASRERPSSIVDHQGWIQIDLAALPDDAEGHQQAHNIIQTVCPSAVVICGAMTAVAACEQNAKQAFATNAVGPAVLAEEALSAGADVVYLSSDYVFNGDNGPYCAQEADDLDPLNVYGRSKLEGERRLAATVKKILARKKQAAEESANSGGMNACGRAFVLRTSTVFGPERRTGKNTVYQLCRSLSEGKAFPSPSDQWGTPTYSKDIAVAIDILLHHGDAILPESNFVVLNVAGPESMPRIDLHRRVAKAKENGLGHPQVANSVTAVLGPISLYVKHLRVDSMYRTSAILGKYGWAATMVEEAILDWGSDWNWGVELPNEALEAC